MNNWKVILATVVIFGAGVFTGGLLVNYVDHPHPRNIHTPGGDGYQFPADRNRRQPMIRPICPVRVCRKFWASNSCNSWTRMLQLTPDQRAAIQKIITDGQERNHAIWTNGPRCARHQDVRQQIRELLTPTSRNSLKN